MNRTRKQWQKANADDLSKFANQAFHAITNAKADIEELHDEISRLYVQNTALAQVVKVAKDAPEHLDRLVKMLRDANEHPEHIRAAETLVANLRHVIAAAESEATNA